MYCGPCNHMIGHGFYQLSPGFFFNFLSHNGFEEIEVLIWTAITIQSFSGSRIRRYVLQYQIIKYGVSLIQKLKATVPRLLNGFASNRRYKCADLNMIYDSIRTV
jgi:hypothetical protein